VVLVKALPLASGEMMISLPSKPAVDCTSWSPSVSSFQITISPLSLNACEASISGMMIDRKLSPSATASWSVPAAKVIPSCVKSVFSAECISLN